MIYIVQFDYRQYIFEQYEDARAFARLWDAVLITLSTSKP